MIDFGEEPSGLLYLSMEYLHGRTLEYDLRSGPLSQARAVAVIHRDVKPANIMLIPANDGDGLPFEFVKVCDFGMATTPANTGNGEDICGTPEYMAQKCSRPVWPRCSGRRCLPPRRRPA